MPRTIRRAKRNRKLTKAHLHQFATGEDFLGEAFGHDKDALREAWEEARTWFLAKWAKEYPGRRPKVWWMFDATQPRRRYDGVMVPPNHPMFGGPVEHFQDWLFERQWEYLLRIGELTDSEVEWLRRRGRIKGTIEKGER